MNVFEISQNANAIMRDIAPYDSGNTMKSIYTTLTLRGFNTTSYGFISPYNIHLENGTRRSGKHVGWFSQDGTYAIFKYLDGVLNGRPTDLTSTYASIAEKVKSTPARKEVLLRAMGGYNG